MNPKALLFLSLVSLALFGWGCKKKTDAGMNATTTGFVSNAYLPPEKPGESENAANIRELREAISNFQNVRTFRAKIQVETTAGQVSGQLDVMKPDRFHGTMQVPGEKGKTESSEVVGVGEMFYIRVSPTQWAYVKTPEKAKALTEAFRSTVDGQDSVLMTVVPDTATVSKMINASRACTQYDTTVTDKEGATFKLSVCVDKGLPKRIEVQPEKGMAAIEYFDYNRLITIERPIGLDL